VTGCNKVSPGCANCYAERYAKRWGKSFQVRVHEHKLKMPSKLKGSKSVFLCSLGDLFHLAVPWEFVDKVYREMFACPRHWFQVLTKRPSNMEILTRYKIVPFWPAHIWHGVSVEAQRLMWRVDELRRHAPGSRKFLSCEPLLGPLELDLTGISWVIVGGESGPGHRPMHADWVRSIRDQCISAGVPFFFKQWGGARPGGRPELDGKRWEEMGVVQ
jgi:protein gp37